MRSHKHRYLPFIFINHLLFYVKQLCHFLVHHWILLVHIIDLFLKSMDLCFIWVFDLFDLLLTFSPVFLKCDLSYFFLIRHLSPQGFNLRNDFIALLLVALSYRLLLTGFIKLFIFLDLPISFGQNDLKLLFKLILDEVKKLVSFINFICEDDHYTH